MKQTPELFLKQFVVLFAIKVRSLHCITKRINWWKLFLSTGGDQQNDKLASNNIEQEHFIVLEYQLTPYYLIWWSICNTSHADDIRSSPRKNLQPYQPTIRLTHEYFLRIWVLHQK